MAAGASSLLARCVRFGLFGRKPRQILRKPYAHEEPRKSLRQVFSIWRKQPGAGRQSSDILLQKQKVYSVYVTKIYYQVVLRLKRYTGLFQKVKIGLLALSKLFVTGNGCFCRQHASTIAGFLSCVLLKGIVRAYQHVGDFAVMR